MRMILVFEVLKHPELPPITKEELSEIALRMEMAQNTQARRVHLQGIEIEPS